MRSAGSTHEYRARHERADHAAGQRPTQTAEIDCVPLTEGEKRREDHGREQDGSRHEPLVEQDENWRCEEAHPKTHGALQGRPDEGGDVDDRDFKPGHEMSLVSARARSRAGRSELPLVAPVPIDHPQAVTWTSLVKPTALVSHILLVESDPSSRDLVDMPDQTLLGPRRDRRQGLVNRGIGSQPCRDRERRRGEFHGSVSLVVKSITRSQPTVVVNLLTVNLDDPARCLRREELGRESDRARHGSRPVDGEREVVHGHFDTGLFPGLTHRGSLRRHGLVLRPTIWVVARVDPTAGKHPVASVKPELGISLEKEKLETRRTRTEKEDGGRRRWG